ncbi:MAG: hypothetical protein MJK04_02845, partial [Psychrosphaera sp.]|nr:hypothetical protein [Psychrosphaera sp.]
MVISETEFLYCTNLGQLFHVDGDQQTQWDDLPQANVLTLFQLGKNHWLLSIREHGIFSLNNGKISRPKQYLPLTNANVEKILTDSSGALWMATTLGVVRFIGEQMQIMTFDEQSARQQKVQSRIFSLLLDVNNTLWAGFYAKGLHRLTPPKVNVIPQMSVRTVIEYDKAYWMGTDLQGVTIKYHNGKTALLTTKDGLPSNTVHALYPDADGNLWLGTTKGLAKYRQGQLTRWDLTQYGLSNWVTTLTSSENGEVWIGTDNGVATIKDGEITIKGDLGKSGKRRVRWLKRGLNGVMWAGTMDGVAFYQAGSWQNPPQSILSDHAQVSFYLDKDGGKWFGSQQGDGLSWLKNNELRRFTTTDGLFDNFIWTITEDASGYLWLSSDKGINRIKRADLENHTPYNRSDNKSSNKSGNKPKILSTTFGRNEGLNPSECNSASPAPWHTKAKKLIFPCMAGLVEIDPQSLPTTQGVPTNAIDYIVFDGNTRWLPNSQNLSAKQRDIRIKYSATGFDNPDKIQFRYRLLGYQAQWQAAQHRRQVSFTNLSAGDYVFEVTSRFYNGHWGQVSAKLPLSIAPHFYERRWFHLLLLLAAAYLVHYLYQQKLNLALRRQTEIEAARIDHLSGLVHNVAHNLNTPVGIAITSASMLPDYSAKLKQMLDSGKISKKGLNDLIDGLTASGSILSKSLTSVSELVERFKQLNIHTYSEQSRLIDITQLMLNVKAEVAFKHPNRTIDWQIEHPPTLTFTSYSEALSQVLQLLADNTLKHGYPASPEAKAGADAIINIQFGLNKKTLNITYQDFGNGMTQQELASLFIPFGNRIGDQKGLG